MSHAEAIAAFLVLFAVLPVLLFFGLRWGARRLLGYHRPAETAAEHSGSKLFVLAPAARSSLAVAIGLSSALWGVMAIHRGWGSPSSIAFDVSCAWFLTGGWLAGEFTRGAWKRLDRPLSKIYQDARQRNLAKTPPLARAMNAGGTILALAGVVGWFT